ncbi:MAG: T9SS type A sorting domain-containing protein, partial [Bacteroidales bacterium]|nr:T9SS type A sorting domain-containing protein [Bacteroidales bacterium]
KPGMLLQNMPNPFKSKTSITYKLFTPGYVKIILSDINGRKTNKMVNAYKEIGEYSIDIPGHSLKEGLYFYSLEMDGLIIETKKMVLINQGE